MKNYLSPRIVNNINKEHNKSEIFISFVLLAFISLMGFLYFISPKGFSDDVPLKPVPIILLIFAPFALARVWISLKGKMNTFLICLSVVMEISLIIGLIWSFHIQYGQKASFYLKSPTFTYLFIFLALRSLRFEIKYLVLSGCLAVSGWLILLIYAIGDDGVITRNFTEYILTDKILIGAETDKIIVIIVVTILLCLSIRKARKMLSDSEAQRMANQELSKFFSKEIADKIIYSENPITPGSGALRDAVTFFIDLRGFTKLSTSIDPRKVMLIIADYQSLAVPIILKHKGSIDKFMGDGILCHFGAAVPSAFCISDALNCIEDLIISFHQRNSITVSDIQYHIGIGCDYGKLIFGAIGDKTRLEFTVIGESVNTSSKLEKHNKKTHTVCLTSDYVYQRGLETGFIPKLKWTEFKQQDIDGLETKRNLFGIEVKHNFSTSDPKQAEQNNKR